MLTFDSKPANFQQLEAFYIHSTGYILNTWIILLHLGEVLLQLFKNMSSRMCVLRFSPPKWIAGVGVFFGGCHRNYLVYSIKQHLKIQKA